MRILWVSLVVVYMTLVLVSLFAIDQNQEEIRWRKSHAALEVETVYHQWDSWSLHGIHREAEWLTTSSEAAMTSPVFENAGAKQTYVSMDIALSGSYLLVYWRLPNEDFSPEKVKYFPAGARMEMMVDGDVEQVQLSIAPGQPPTSFTVREIRVQKYR